MTPMTYTQEVLQQQFILKVGKYNRASESLGFKGVHFYDSIRRRASYLLTIKIPFKTFAFIPRVMN
jgi:hypothetical protein